MGRIRRPHGIRGEVAVEVLSDLPERFAAGSELLAVTATGAVRPLRVEASRPHSRGVLVRFEGCGDRAAVEELRGTTLEVARSAVPPAPEGTYYHFELEGCRCSDRRAGALGEVVGVMEDGGGLILRVVGGGREVLVPFVAGFLRRVDVAAGEIELDLPEGLLETCASTS